MTEHKVVLVQPEFIYVVNLHDRAAGIASSFLPNWQTLAFVEQRPLLATAPTGSTAMNLVHYCHTYYGEGSSICGIANLPHSWSCESGTRNIDMNLRHVCEVQSGTGYRAAIGGPGAPDAWFCVP